MRAQSNPVVDHWANVHFADSYLCTPVLFEIWHGLDAMPDGKRQRDFLDRFDRLRQRFGPRVQDFDTRSARSAAQLIEAARRQGRVLQEGDAQIAGIAAAYNLTLVTRNVRDFEMLEIELINPWEAA
jgi:toxin FitB